MRRLAALAILLAAIAACRPEPKGDLRAVFVPAAAVARTGVKVSLTLRLQNTGGKSRTIVSAASVGDGLRAERLTEGPGSALAATPLAAARPPVGGWPSIPLSWPRGRREDVVVDLPAAFADLARPGRYRVSWEHAAFACKAVAEIHIVESYALLQTNTGDIVIEFHPEDAPNTVANFVSLVKKGFYNGLTFHRIIPGFMMQGGCPKGDGLGGPGYTLQAEFNSRKHTAGTVSMARTEDPNSAGSQFFICFAPIAHLDGQYTAFAEVVRGLDVVRKIEPIGTAGGRPKERVVMEKVSLLESLPPTP